MRAGTSFVRAARHPWYGLTGRNALRRVPWRKVHRTYDHNLALHAYEQSVIVRKLAIAHEEDGARIHYTPAQIATRYPDLFNVPYLRRALDRLWVIGIVERTRSSWWGGRWAYALKA